MVVKWVVVVWWVRCNKCNILTSHFVMNTWHKKECVTIIHILGKFNIKSQKDLCQFRTVCHRHITIWWDMVNTHIKINFNKELVVVVIMVECLLQISILMIWVKIPLIRQNPRDQKNQTCLFFTYLMTGVSNKYFTSF